MGIMSEPYQQYLASLQGLLQAAQHSDDILFETITNAPFYDRLQTTHLGLGIIGLTLLDPDTLTIDRRSLSATESAFSASRIISKPFTDIKIPYDYTDNLLAKAIKMGEWQQTADWQNLFVPELTAREARFNQAEAGIECSVVYPLNARAGGTLIFSYFEPPRNIDQTHHDFMQTYARIAGKALRQELS